MTKQKTLRRVVVLFIGALLCSMSFLCVTLAKYQSTYEGTGSGTMATWEFEVYGEKVTTAEKFTAKINDDKVIKPGDTGSFKIVLENVGSVDADYVISIDDGYEKPLAFSTGFDANQDPSSGTIEAGETVVVFVTWTWEFEMLNNDDMEWYSIENQAKLIELPITIELTQVAPSAQQA